MRKLLLALLVLGCGALGAAGGDLLITEVIPRAPLPPAHPINQALGIIKPRVIGYLPYFLMSRADTDYRPYLTDLAYFGLVVQPDGTLQKLVNPHEQEPGYTALGSKFATFSAPYKQAGIPTSLLVHAADEDTIVSLMANPAAAGATLAAEALPAMKTYGFSDLNLDIESFRVATPGARASFTTFLSTVTTAVHAEKAGTVTVEISPTALIKPYLIDPAEAGKIADFVIVMGYDYHYTGSYVAGPVAPTTGAGTSREYDVETAVKLATAAMPNEKLILGIPLYGYEWESLSATPSAGIVPGSGIAASAARLATLLSGCPTCTVSRDPDSGERVVVKPDAGSASYHQFFVPDAQSVIEKLALATKYHLAGVALWALGYEDNSILSPLTDYKQSYRLIPDFSLNRGWK